MKNVALCWLIFKMLTMPSLMAQCEEVLKLHHRKFDWFIQKNLDSLDHLIHSDLRYIHSNGWIENKQEVLMNLKTEHLKYHKVDVHDCYCRFEGSTAIVIGSGEFSVALDQKQIGITLLYTEVYVLTEQGWKFFSRHACKV